MSNWIKVAAMIPSVDEEGVSTICVLVTGAGGLIFEAYYALDGSKGWYSPVEFHSGCSIIPFDVTHWMHKPTMP